MSEQFSIMIGNRSRFDAGDPGGYWLDMPATKWCGIKKVDSLFSRIS